MIFLKKNIQSNGLKFGIFMHTRRYAFFLIHCLSDCPFPFPLPAYLFPSSRQSPFNFYVTCILLFCHFLITALFCFQSPLTCMHMHTCSNKYGYAGKYLTQSLGYILRSDVDASHGTSNYVLCVMHHPSSYSAILFSYSCC